MVSVVRSTARWLQWAGVWLGSVLVLAFGLQAVASIVGLTDGAVLSLLAVGVGIVAGSLVLVAFDPGPRSAHPVGRDTAVRVVVLLPAAVALLLPGSGTVDRVRWPVSAASILVAGLVPLLVSRLEAVLESARTPPGLPTAQEVPGRFRLGVAVALPWILVLGMAVNLVFLDRAVPTAGRPIHFHSSGDLSVVVRASGPSVVERYSLYVELGEVLNGGALLVADPHLLESHLLRGLSGLMVVVRDVGSLDIESLDLRVARSGVVRTGYGLLQYRIMEGPASATSVVLRDDGGLVIIPGGPVGPADGGS